MRGESEEDIHAVKSAYALPSAKSIVQQLRSHVVGVKDIVAVQRFTANARPIYSPLRASIGSTRMARRAGRSQARVPTTNSNAVAMARVRISAGFTPNSRPATHSPAPNT